MNEGVEQENYKLRKKLGELEAKIESDKLIHESDLSQIATVERCNGILAKGNADLLALAELWKTACLEERKLNVAKKNADRESGVDSEQPEIIIGTIDVDMRGAEESPLARDSPKVSEIDASPSKSAGLPNNDGRGPQSSGSQYNLLSKCLVETMFVVAEDNRLPKSPVLDSTRDSVVKSNEVNREDIFQGVRKCERYCNDIDLANQCLASYFMNMHPLIPVLHQEAFYKLYRLYCHKVLADQANHVLDASTREGRAVTLICSVLALGALSLNAVDDNQQRGNHTEGSQSYFGLGLGFYVTCMRLLAYSHDTVETMMAYLFMVCIW